MKKAYRQNEKIGFLDSLIWDYSYQEDIDLMVRSNVNPGFITLCFAIILAIIAIIS